MATRRLVVDDGNTSAAIVSLFETMPAVDQAALLADLAPAPAPSLDGPVAKFFRARFVRKLRPPEPV